MKTADVTAIVRESQRQEAQRIAFLERERGQAEARAFALRTLRLYRHAVVFRSAPAGDPTLRLRLLGSYCYFKRYLGATAQRTAQRTGFSGPRPR